MTDTMPKLQFRNTRIVLLCLAFVGGMGIACGALFMLSSRIADYFGLDTFCTWVAIMLAAYILSAVANDVADYLKARRRSK